MKKCANNTPEKIDSKQARLNRKSIFDIFKRNIIELDNVFIRNKEKATCDDYKLYLQMKSTYIASAQTALAQIIVAIIISLLAAYLTFSQIVLSQIIDKSAQTTINFVGGIIILLFMVFFANDGLKLIGDFNMSKDFEEYLRLKQAKKK